MQLLRLGQDGGKKHTPYIEILLWLQARMLNPKLFSSWKKRGSRKIKTKTSSQTYSNLHIHTLSFSHRCSYSIYPSKPPSTHLNTILITAMSTHAPTFTYTHFLSHPHIYTYVIHGLSVYLSLCFSHDTMILQQLDGRETFIESCSNRVKSSKLTVVIYVLEGLGGNQKIRHHPCSSYVTIAW